MQHALSSARHLGPGNQVGGVGGDPTRGPAQAATFPRSPTWAREENPDGPGGVTGLGGGAPFPDWAAVAAGASGLGWLPSALTGLRGPRAASAGCRGLGRWRLPAYWPENLPSPLICRPSERHCQGPKPGMPQPLPFFVSGSSQVP